MRNHQDGTYWVAVSHRTNLFTGNGRVSAPRLYGSEKLARAAHRRFRETDEELDARMEFREVTLVKAVTR